jgi:hypothetical protein
MKNSFLFIAFVGIMACANEAPKQAEAVKTTTPMATEVKADTLQTPTFSCPMHLEVKGKETDKCPKCGMALTHRD